MSGDEVAHVLATRDARWLLAELVRMRHRLRATTGAVPLELRSVEQGLATALALAPVSNVGQTMEDASAASARWVTTRELCSIVNWDERRVRRWAMEMRAVSKPGVVRASSGWVFHPDRVKELLDAQGDGSVADVAQRSRKVPARDGHRHPGEPGGR